MIPKNHFGRPALWRSRKSLRGFTLIELLVVIAIIALLVSILMPSLGKAKDLAQTAVCLSNIRNVGFLFQLYAEDFDGRYPPVYDLEGMQEMENSWAGYFIRQYLDLDKKPFACPVAQKMFSPPMTVFTVHYGYNSYIPLLISVNSHGWDGKPDAMPAPSNIILTADTVNNITNPLTGYYWAHDYFPYIHPRHNDNSSVNTLYCDGHVVTNNGELAPEVGETSHPFHKSHFARMTAAEMASW